jgi:D-alanyl-D-alanine dipeptidase
MQPFAIPEGPISFARPHRPIFAALVCLAVSTALAAQTQVPVWPREPDAPNAPKPAPPSAAQSELVGEYESAAGSHLYLIERDGRLWTLVDRAEPQSFDPSGSNVDRGGGRVSGVRLGGAQFRRLQVGPADGRQLQIVPLRPVADALQNALAATPPKEAGPFRASDLVEVVTLDASITLEIRYATTNNFAGAVFYSQSRAFLQRPAAEAVVRANRALQALGYGLRIHDGYRPWFVTKTFWDVTPADKKWLVANPDQASKHNRGCAVDLTLYDLKTGAVIEMPSTYDESTPRAYAFYPGGTSLQRWHRALLRRTMVAEGFSVNPEEWWHFDYKDWREYAIGNVPFERLR